jgi:sugar lactone lactonase YvrE
LIHSNLFNPMTLIDFSRSSRKLLHSFTVITVLLFIAASCRSPAGQEMAPPQTFTVSTLAGSGTFGFANNANPLLAQFNGPSAVAVDGIGNVLVADQNNQRIRRIAAGSGAVTTLAGGGVGNPDDNTNPLLALFSTPSSLALDAGNNIFVAEFGSQRIRRIAASNGAVTTFAGSGNPGFTDGPAASAQFNFPYGVAVDASGNVFVADYSNHRIRRIAAGTGTVTTLAGNGTAGLVNGAPATAQFNFPRGVAVDASGNVYVADQSNNVIRRIAAGTGTVTTLAGSGVAGFADNANPLQAQFNSPSSVAVDASGNVYVADRVNNRIRRIDGASGAVSTMAGNGTIGFADGPGASAQFSAPMGVAVDANRRVYVADVANHRIRVIQ